MLQCFKMVTMAVLVGAGARAQYSVQGSMAGSISVAGNTQQGSGDPVSLYDTANGYTVYADGRSYQAYGIGGNVRLHASLASQAAPVALSATCSGTVVVSITEPCRVSISSGLRFLPVGNVQWSSSGSIDFNGTSTPLAVGVAIADVAVVPGQTITLNFQIGVTAVAAGDTIDADVGLEVCANEIGVNTVSGLRSATVGDYAVLPTAGVAGRLFVGVTNDAPVNQLTGEQSTFVSVHVHSMSAEGILWELFDPDDPAQSPLLDPNGARGGDNTGKHEHSISWLEPGFTPALAPATDVVGANDVPGLGTLIATMVTGRGSLETPLVSIRLNYSADGGDNYILRASLVTLQGNGYGVIGEPATTQTMTVWRYRELHTYQMSDPSTGGGFDTEMTQSRMQAFLANSDPDYCAYIDTAVFDHPSPLPYLAPMAVIPDRVSPYMDGTALFIHALGRYSLIGVDTIAGDSGMVDGNTDRQPHSVVALSPFRFGGIWGVTPQKQAIITEQLHITAAHEVVHSILSDRCSGPQFHDIHTAVSAGLAGHLGAGEKCALNSLKNSTLFQRTRGPYICERHLSMLRDYAALAVGSHDPALGVRYDSIISR